MRPLIGVTTSEVRRPPRTAPTKEADPARWELALGLEYLRAVEDAGGLPVALPPTRAESIGALLERLDGVLLSGGPDLHPSAYGGDEAHPHLGPTEQPLDLFELGVARAADDRGLPLLGVCRGLQAINVVRGGTLIPHLPDLGLAVDHRQTAPGSETSHDVRIDPASRLASVMGARREVAVNSFHHQAVDRLGAGLVASAWCHEDVVEGIEDPSRPFLLGVQWHAEGLRDHPEHAALFGALIDAARPRRLREAA